MRTKSLLLVLFAWCSLAMAGLLHAQDYRGRIEGTVVDSSRAVVPGAMVNLTNTKTGVSTVRKSNGVGQYIFDYVEPGEYQVVVEASGFRNFEQHNVSIEAKSDVRVDVTLNPGAPDETIVVETAPVAVQFDTATASTTIDEKMANDLPSLSRNPFEMASLDPSVYTSAYFATQPFVSWSAASMQIGGNSSYAADTNEVMVDSTPVGLGAKTSYTPPMDAVEQVVVQSNPMDASYGNTAGGTLQVVMKSGANAWHGNVWYLGRYPFMQAWSDRTIKTPNTTRQNMWGGSLGNPIIKNKLFNFFVYEQWKMSVPTSWVGTVPTALQRKGDFSQTFNADGSLATIYNPMTSTFDPVTGRGSRRPFPGNIVPISMIDPIALKIMNDMWLPNNPGDNITGINNFKSSYSASTDYLNFSDRVDYAINKSWRVYGRVDRFHTIVTDSFPTASAAFVDPDGSARNAFTTSADAIYTINPTTILNLHGDYNSFVDGYKAGKTLSGGYSSVWPSGWYNSFAVDAPTLYPRMVVNGTAFGSPWVYWYDSPFGQSYNATLNKQLRAHSLKVGVGYQRQVNKSISYAQDAFNFSSSMTANDFIQPQTNISGNGYASFLLGAMDSNSTVYTTPHKQALWRYYDAYVQDDWKASDRWTFNVGLRWEYEAPLTDPQNRLGRYLDLSVPNPTLQSGAPQLSSTVTQYRSAAPIWNGYYNFETSSHPNMYDAPKIVLMPRLGVAFKVDDKTALRLGYGRFIMPFAKSSYNNSLGVAYPGLDASQNPLPAVLGVPQVFLQNPFPSTSPLVAPLGSQYGANYGLGSSVTWYKPNFTPGSFNRFNLSIQRQLPGKVVIDTSAFFNYGTNLPLRYDVNLADPNKLYTYKGALLKQVDNPFYQFGTPLTFPGPLRNQKTVSIYSLLTPYPQYSQLYYQNNIGKDRYTAFQLKAQRPFVNGYNFLIGYNYNREQTLQYFNDINQYANHLSWREVPSPRHRLSAAAIYEVPVGKGRRFFAHSPSPVLAVIGGWQLSGIYSYHSGDYLQIGSYQVDSNPAISNPTATHWFDTTKFHLLAPYTPRSNPYTYPGLTGPRFQNLDLSIVKDFALNDHFKSQLKLSTYNATNTLMRSDPDMNVQSSTFGEALRQSNFEKGRQTEIGLKILF